MRKRSAFLVRKFLLLLLFPRTILTLLNAFLRSYFLFNFFCLFLILNFLFNFRTLFNFLILFLYRRLVIRCFPYRFRNNLTRFLQIASFLLSRLSFPRRLFHRFPTCCPIARKLRRSRDRSSFLFFFFNS